MTSNFNKRYWSFQIAFVICNTNAILIIPSQNIYHILNPSTLPKRELLSFMFDIITIEQAHAYLYRIQYQTGTLGCKKEMDKRACPHYEEIDACLIR